MAVLVMRGRATAAASLAEFGRGIFTSETSVPKGCNHWDRGVGIDLGTRPGAEKGNRGEKTERTCLAS